jgi:hypothetical protein
LLLKGKRAVKVKFTRHAKRRTKLYQISEDNITKILLEKDFLPGQHEIVRKTDFHPYPIKIIFSKEYDILTVISAYPLKKRLKK